MSLYAYTCVDTRVKEAPSKYLLAAQKCILGLPLLNIAALWFLDWLGAPDVVALPTTIFGLLLCGAAIIGVERWEAKDRKARYQRNAARIHKEAAYREQMERASIMETLNAYNYARARESCGINLAEMINGEIASSLDCSERNVFDDAAERGDAFPNN